jgi:60 kDa SS-A/Ro ribonucleoprotein
VLFLSHAKPKDDEQKALWERLIADELKTPDTWEVALSGGADKKEAFERLLKEGTLGYLALLRNLRNMEQAGVDRELVKAALLARKGAQRVLPFRYVAAARAAPQVELAIDQALCAAIAELPRLKGRTVVMVDVSRSMEDRLSAKSDMTRMDAAAALAAIVNSEDIQVCTFSDGVVMVPPRRGMAGVDAVKGSQPHNSTRLFDAVAAVNKEIPHDRVIVITDEQAQGNVRFGHYIVGALNSLPAPTARHAYMINVASAQNGVGYRNGWTHIDGFSEGVLKYIHAMEAEAL